MPVPKYAPALAALLTLSASPVFAQDMPDMSGMDMKPASPWHVMTHAAITFVADHQEGPRGGSKSFAEGMVMIMANRALDDTTTLDLNLMLSPDPFMGKGGYPLLLQTGETADGVHPLLDAQHPHDLFMGMTAQVTHRFSEDMRGFIKIGWPGEFGFGPQAFMHRASGENFPTAPISHHWFDSGHVSMGVVTAGFAQGPLQLEVTQFTGREPDQYRFNLDRPRLDSTAIRATWAITADLSAQASWARQISPEQLEPDVNLIRNSLSMDYGHAFTRGTLYSTLGYARKYVEHGTGKASDAYLFENTFHFNGPWLALARYERVYNDELVPGAWWVAKTELGLIRTFDIGHDTTLGLGLVRQFNTVPDALKAAYGDHPDGTVGFVQLKIHPMMAGMQM